MIALDKIKIIISSLKAQLLLGFLLLFAGCENLKDEYSFSGATMGTTYIVKIVSSDIEIDLNAIERGVDSLLVQLNKQMSTWDPESEVSKFNKWYSKKPFSVSNDFLNVVSKAIIITDKTDGYFDPTVYDLMSLWGFGPNPKSGFPDIEDIHRALKSSGKGSIKIYDGNLIKNHEGSKLDLNAIAKGYGVDKIYKYLKLKGFENIFVEIGGEVRCSGKNRKNKNWSIGIEDPSLNGIDQKEASAVISLNNKAIATSGNYRNFVDLDGEILGHTINPQTGFPVQTDVLSVSVISSSCMISDAWATALMAMNFETGYAKVEKNKDIDAIWITASSDNEDCYISKSGDVDIKQTRYSLK